MGISERIEAKLDAIIKHLGIDSQLAGEASHTALTGTAPQSVGADTELDAAGFPYDARIHSGSKEKVANGTWKYKRGVSQGDKDSVENEYRAAGYGSAAVAVDGNGAGAQETAQSETVQTVEQTPPPAAPAAPTAPGLTLPVAPAPVVAAPVKVSMPEYIQGSEIDDSKLTAIGAALYAQEGEPVYKKFTQLFQLPEGAPLTDLTTPEWRDSFHRLATDKSLWAQYGLA